MIGEKNLKTNLVCKPSDRIECTDCGGIFTIQDNLIPVLGRRFPKSNGDGFWQQIFYYCPCDKHKKWPKVFDAGDGILKLVFRATVKLIESQ
ncbi:MAG: hypothetical protein Q7S77_00600 [Candidatus Staskawiczbacteria bacterium]|nr:hypothetical protein [Candidatus Staskawiczbacteria bacterium]